MDKGHGLSLSLKTRNTPTAAPRSKLQPLAGEFEYPFASLESDIGHVFGFRVTLKTFVGLVIAICQHDGVVTINWHCIR